MCKKKDILGFAPKKDQYILFPIQNLKKKLTKASFFLRKIHLKSLSIAQSMDNFAAHYFRYLDMRYCEGKTPTVFFQNYLFAWISFPLLSI